MDWPDISFAKPQSGYTHFHGVVESKPSPLAFAIYRLFAITWLQASPPVYKYLAGHRAIQLTHCLGILTPTFDVGITPIGASSKLVYVTHHSRPDPATVT